MSNQTFYVVIASVLMLVGTAASMLLNAPGQQGEQALQTIRQEKINQQENLLLPETVRILEAYGANYSEEYAQWSFSERMTFETVSGEGLYAPISGIVRKIEKLDSGSRIIVDCVEGILEIYPVYGVRSFEGSRITQQTILGTIGSTLTMRAEKDGFAVDPMFLFEDEEQNILEGALQTTGESGSSVE